MDRASIAGATSWCGQIRSWPWAKMLLAQVRRPQYSGPVVCRVNTHPTCATLDTPHTLCYARPQEMQALFDPGVAITDLRGD